MSKASFRCLRPLRRRAQLQRQVIRRPPIGAVRIPGDMRIAHCDRSLRRVPRHPAIRQAIEHQHAVVIAASWPAARPVLEILFHYRRERSISGVRQPDAARNVFPRFLTPDRRGRQTGRTRRLRQHIDEHRVMVLPLSMRLVRRQHARAMQCRRRRRAIVVHPIARRFRRRIRCRGHEQQVQWPVTPPCDQRTVFMAPFSDDPARPAAARRTPSEFDRSQPGSPRSAD